MAAVAVMAAIAVGSSACTAHKGSGATASPLTAAPTSTLPPVPTAQSATKFSDAPMADYVTAIRAAARLHLRVWIEVNMVKRWEGGPVPFRDAVKRVAELANQPGVAGIKIADELGYHDGLDSSSKISQFLANTAQALRKAAPGRPILADMVLPALGCMPGAGLAGPGPAACAASATHQYPQLALPQVDGYLRLHAIDVLDLSTGIMPGSTYAAWGTTQAAAQQAAWKEVTRRGWGALVRLQARKALAHPGRYPGTPAQAAADLHTFVDVPLATGAHAVDVWTWHQEYQGAMYRLMNPGLQTNALWAGLQQRHAQYVLFTHMSPHSVESGLNADLAMIATAFTDIFIPAGTG